MPQQYPDKDLYELIEEIEKLNGGNGSAKKKRQELPIIVNTLWAKRCTDIEEGKEYPVIKSISRDALVWAETSKRVELEKAWISA